MKILMVCLGNICRSPMAEGILKSKIDKHGLHATVDSAGFESFHLNDPPDKRAISTMKQNGIDISNYKMRLFRVEDFDTFNKIYVMDRYNYQDVLSMARNESDASKVDLIMNVIEPGSDKIIPDPYYGGNDGFSNVFNLLDRATEIIVNNIKSGKL